MDLWHSNFPTKIFLKYPKDKVALFIDSQLEDEYDHYIRYEKSETKGIFECDMTKFRSWFNKEKYLAPYTLIWTTNNNFSK